MNTRNNRIRIALTGHGPNELVGGCDYFHPSNLEIAKRMSTVLVKHLKQGKVVHAISGVDLGTGQIFALEALKLKKQGFPVTLEVAIPCANQADKWPADSQKIWQDIVDQADKVTYTSREACSPQQTHKRNMYLVNHCDEIIAVFNGKRREVGSCVRYAKKRNKPVIIIDPRSLVILVDGNLLLSDCDVVIYHPNFMSTMESDLARQIKAMYPQAFDVDRLSEMSPIEKLGNYSSVQVPSSNNKQIEIVHLYDQIKHRWDSQYTEYDKLESGIFSYLEDKQSACENLSELKIGAPYNMGCDREGKEWNRVLDILERAAAHFKIHIYTYKYTPKKGVE